jgi:hypothetical protein
MDIFVSPAPVFPSTNSNNAALNRYSIGCPEAFPNNVKEINSIIINYETILIGIESINPYYHKISVSFFDDLHNVGVAINKSTQSKHSKKAKDNYFADASGDLKDSTSPIRENQLKCIRSLQIIGQSG